MEPRHLDHVTYRAVAMRALKATNDEIDEKTPSARRVKRAPGLVEEAYNLIRADIISLKIPPDTRIPVDSLVRELGVSQTPIREALIMLEGIGLVSKKRHIGFCTAPTLNKQEFDNLHEVRLLIEPFVARRATERMTDADLQDLTNFAQNMECGDTRASYNRFADQDCEFHNRLASASGNELVAEAYDRLHAHMHIFRLRFHNDVTSEGFAEHTDIIHAMQARDPDRAENAMRTHLYRSYNRLVKFARD